MHHKQCSLLGKLSLHGGTVIASCLYLASRTRSHRTILQGGFSNSPGWNLLSPQPADVEACLIQIDCSSLHLLVQGPHPPLRFKFSPTSQQHLLPQYPHVQSCPFLIHLQRSEWSSLESRSDHVISVFVTHLVLPADPLGKIPAPSDLAPHSYVHRASNTGHEMTVLDLVDGQMGFVTVFILLLYMFKIFKKKKSFL